MRRLLAAILFVLLGSFSLLAQDSKGQMITRGATLPSICETGEIFNLIVSGEATLYVCASTNSWQLRQIKRQTTAPLPCTANKDLWVDTDGGTAGQQLYLCNATGDGYNLVGDGGGGGTNHNILSATHTDSLAASPVLGDILHANAAPAWARLAGNITATKNFLTQTGNGTISAVPAWGTIAAGDVPTLNQNTTGTAAGLSAILALASGGTNQTAWTAARCVRVNTAGTALEAFSADCGGGTGSQHSIDGVNLTANDPINFQDTASINFTNPSAGNVQAAVLVVTDAMVPNDISLDNITQIGTRSHTSLSDIGTNTHPTIDTHIAATAAHGATGAVMGTTNAQSPTNKTLDAGIATTTHAAGANFLQVVRHATDCTAITDGLDGEFCYEKDSNRNFMCEPTAGGCDTAAEWIDTTPSGGGITSLGSQTGATQTFSKVDDTNVTLAITSATNNHEFALGWTGILGSARGGTGNGFTLFSGPATTEKTFTLPNASATILTTNALVTGAQGGTNNGFFEVTGPATTLKTFTFPNVSSTVLTTNAAVTVAQGGTGAATLTGLLQGNGTSAFTAITNSAVVGAILRVTAASTYAWGPLDLADLDATTGALNTANSVGDAALATGAVDGGLGGEIADGTVDSNDLVAANKTLTKSITILDPTTGETNQAQWYWPAAVTLNRIACSVDAGTSATINFDERAEATPNTAGTNTLSAGLVCDTNSQTSCAAGCDVNTISDTVIAADVPHNLQITAVSGVVGAVRIHLRGTVN